MTLQYVRDEFIECPACRAKPGSPALCRECLERRELYAVLAEMRVYLSGLVRGIAVCGFCRGEPHLECPEHGR